MTALEILHGLWNTKQDISINGLSTRRYIFKSLDNILELFNLFNELEMDDLSYFRLEEKLDDEYIIPKNQDNIKNYFCKKCQFISFINKETIRVMFEDGTIGQNNIRCFKSNIQLV